MKIEFFKNLNNHQVKIRQFIALVLGICFLFLISQNARLKEAKRISTVSETNFINEKKVSSKELFLTTFTIIKQNYFMRDLNGQGSKKINKWKERYINKIQDDEDAYVAINSILVSLNDPYSKFMKEEEYLLQNRAINSKLYGIGINISSSAGKIYVANVLENAPAYLSGIRAGDIILKINDEDLSGHSIYHAAQLIRGDVNETITLEILRKNEILVKSIKREEIKIKTIEYKKIDDNIGYIRILSFIGYDTVSDFIIALNKLKDTEGLIIDLRGNSGGLFQNAAAIANLFMEEGLIVNVIARQGKKNTYSATNAGVIYDNPIIILIDRYSASASEILASALHDNNKAKLVGEKSYGKGLVQKVFSLPNKTGMNLTIARYLTPKEQDINGAGIEPDYDVSLSHKDFLMGIDTQLEFALGLLK